MKRLIEGEDRGQGTLLAGLLDDYVAVDNPVRVVDVVVEEQDLAGLGFNRMQPAKTGRAAIGGRIIATLRAKRIQNTVQCSVVCSTGRLRPTHRLGR